MKQLKNWNYYRTFFLLHFSLVNVIPQNFGQVEIHHHGAWVFHVVFQRPIMTTIQNIQMFKKKSSQCLLQVIKYQRMAENEKSWIFFMNWRYSGHHSSSNQIHHHGQDRMQEPVRPGAPPINRLVDTFNKPSHLNLTPKINLIDSRKFTDPYASQAQDLSCILQ